MTIPKEIREKIEEKQKLDAELKEWYEENLNIEGCDIYFPKIVDNPQGEEQTDDGEYCDQRVLGADWYAGTYYWRMDNGKYLSMNYEI